MITKTMLNVNVSRKVIHVESLELSDYNITPRSDILKAHSAFYCVLLLLKQTVFIGFN